jgi:ribosomal protein S18 acetylase RimI-like enzyme
MFQGPEFTIRPLTATDEPLLWEMLYQGVHAIEGEMTPEQIMQRPEYVRHVEQWGRPGDTGFVAHDKEEGKPLGAVWLRNIEPTQDVNCELAFAVRHGHRRRGIGVALLTQFVKANPDRSAILISAPPTNPAVRLYERFGFKVVQQTPNSVTMRREV